MKSKLMISSALLWCLSAAAYAGNAVENPDSLALVNAEWNWKSIGKGGEAGSAKVKMFGSDQTISAVKYPAARFKTKILHCPGDESSTTDMLANRHGYTVGVNGSYFNMRTLEPCTFFAMNRSVISLTPKSEGFRTNGLLAFKKKNGREMEVLYCDSTKFDQYRKNYNMVIASGPVLIKDGDTGTFAHDKYFTEKRHPRTVVGQDAKGNYWFIVIDGRFPGVADGATIPETAAIARYFGLKDAINFDGGGSSTLWTEATGVISYPCDNKKFDHVGCRRVPNVIVAK